MKISHHWLKEYIKTECSPEEIAQKLTASGLEVEGIENYEEINGSLKGLIIGTVITCEKHPNADKLKVTSVDLGNNQIVQIVCGAPNVAAGQKVIVAPPGTVLYKDETEWTIQKTKIRGIESQGMICAEDEIGLGSEHNGIIELDTTLENGTPAQEFYHPFTDIIFEIGLTPNRSDASSHFGVARELHALLDISASLPDLNQFSSPLTTHDTPLTPHSIQIIIENPDACNRYAGILLDNVKIEDSPKWLKRKLQSIGLKPINNVVDITNFVLHECGQPLHAFDADEIIGNKIVIKNATENSTFSTLDGITRKLNSTDLMICNQDEPMCMAGIMGGIHSGIKSGTNRVFLESACFSPLFISRSCRFHTLNTDASFRFSRGTDPDMVIYALKRATLLIQEIAGGKIISQINDVYPKPIEPKKVFFNWNKISSTLGLEIETSIIKKILNNLDIKIIEENTNGVHLQIPLYRTDVLREIDVIEEIIRIYGLDKIPIPSKINASPALNTEMLNENLTNVISDHLCSLGFSEMQNNSLLSKSQFQKITPDQSVDSEVITLLNPVSEDFSMLRNDPLLPGLQTLAYNLNRKNQNLKLFEFGFCYKKNTIPSFTEMPFLILISTGMLSPESWYNKKNNELNIYTFNSFVISVFNKLGLNPDLKIAKSHRFYDNKVDFFFNNQIIAEAGTVNRKILKTWIDFEQDVFYARFDWQEILKSIESNNSLKFRELPRFPFIRRDIAMVLPKVILASDIIGSIKLLGIKMIRDINIFDLYEGENIEKDKKSVALSFILQDDTKTLRDKEADQVIKQIQTHVEIGLNATFRK